MTRTFTAFQALLDGVDQNVTDLTTTVAAQDETITAEEAAFTADETALAANKITLAADQATITDLNKQIVALKQQLDPTDDNIPGWGTPTWRDEFDAPTMDATKWNARTAGYATDSSYNLPANVTVANSQLVLTGKNQVYGGRNWTSGYVDTCGKFALPTYFRLEVRARVPLTTGMWAAPVWLRNDAGGAGEIDLVETYASAPSAANQTLHTDYSADHMSHASVAWSSLANKDPLAFHTYVIEKIPGQVTIKVDEQARVFTPAMYPYFNQFYEAGVKWNLRVCLQIGNHDKSGLPNATTDWTKSAMVLDYVRVYTYSG